MESPKGGLCSHPASANRKCDVNGEERGAPPVELDLRVGEHDVRVAASGFHTFERTVDVQEGETTTVHAELEERVPLTKKWWFWAILGGAVLIGGAVALGVVLAPDAPEPLPSDIPAITAMRVGP